MCGRKKLPFAGYSVVKDLTKKLSAVGYQPSAAGGRLRGSFTPNSLVFPMPAFAATRLGRGSLRTRRRPLQRAGLPSRSPLARELQRAKAGGEYRARTGDLLVANQALSQLS